MGKKVLRSIFLLPLIVSVGVFIAGLNLLQASMWRNIAWVLMLIGLVIFIMSLMFMISGKKKFWTLLLIPVICCITVVAVNNMSAKLVEEKLSAPELPENTILVDSLSAAGKFVGNGNGMQYVGAILLKSDLTLEELQEHYTELQEHPAYASWYSDCTVVAMETATIPEIDLRFSEKLEEGAQYYAVYAWGNGVEPFASIDLRGH